MKNYKLYFQDFSRLFKIKNESLVSIILSDTFAILTEKFAHKIHLYPTRYYPIMLFVESRFQNSISCLVHDTIYTFVLSITYSRSLLALSSFLILLLCLARFFPLLFFFLFLNWQNVFEVRRSSIAANRVFIINHINRRKQNEEKRREAQGSTNYRLFRVISSSESNDYQILSH